MIFLTLGVPLSFFWCGFLFSDKDIYRYRYKMCKKVSPIKSKYHSNYLFQIRKLHMVLFKLEMIQANKKLFYTEKKNYTTKCNTIKLP
jgi:hypothetical protein